MTPSTPDNRPAVEPQPPIFVPPESETRPEAATEIVGELHKRFCSDIPNDGTYTLALNETETIRFFGEVGRLIHAHVAAETAGLRAEIERLKKNVGCARQQGTTQFCAEVVALRALIVKQDEALREIEVRDRFDNVEVRDKALALTPKDLEGCVVVKRSDFERRVIAAPMRCSKCGKMVESPTTGFSLNTCFWCGGEMKTCRRPDTLEGALIRIEELEEDSLRIANGSEVARLREAIKWNKTQDDLEAAELFVLHDEIAALKAKCEDANRQRDKLIPQASNADMYRNELEQVGLVVGCDHIESLASCVRQTFDKAEADLTACREELWVANVLKTKHLHDCVLAQQDTERERGNFRREELAHDKTVANLATLTQRNAALEKLLTESVSRIQEMDGESPLVKAIMKAL